MLVYNKQFIIQYTRYEHKSSPTELATHCLLIWWDLLLLKVNNKHKE
jgi:hypothetical protein